MTTHSAYSTMPQKVSSIIGSYVVTPNGESLGDIRDIMVDPRTGMVTYCVVSFGGFMGLGRNLFAVPFNAFNYDLGENEYVLETSKKHFRASPGFDENRWPTRAEEQWNIFAKKVDLTSQSAVDLPMNDRCLLAANETLNI